jgi:tRNA dimethylallyltransferase
MQVENIKQGKRLPPLVMILGPTAVGKTEIAIRIAERVHGEIISADSRLFYRGMDIGTAKPSGADRMRVRHHLIDVAEPNEIWSLVKYQKAARHAAAEIFSSGAVPLLVGGTGQYIRAVVEDWSPPSVIPDQRMRQVLENWADEISALGLHQRLSILDPTAAKKIEPNNLRRSIRALEVIFSTGRRFSELRKRGTPVYDCLQLGIRRPRTELFERIDTRIDAMLANGFIDEVRDLLGQGYSATLPSMSAIGYYEINAYLAGRVTLEEAIMLVKRRTRQYVRRQANWFKANDPGIQWFNFSETIVDDLVSEILDWCKARIG